MGIAFIPLYIRYLGIDAYGLVGILAVLQSATALLDTGMTPTFNREMARYLAGARTLESTLDLLRSLEFLYAGFGLTVVVAVWVASPWLATHWLQSGHIPPATISRSLTIMAIVVALKTCEIAYRGAIQGMQRQVWLNAVQAGMATLRWVGALGVLLVTPSIDAYFLWQGMVSLVTFLIYMRQTYRWLAPTSHRGRFSLGGLRSIAHFAGGLGATTLVTLLLTQSDKILLAKFFPLRTLGYYTLASTTAAMLTVFVYPMSSALYPRLTEQVTRADTRGEVQTYLAASEWLSVLIVPPALTLAVFAKMALFAWSGDAALAQHVAPIVRLLILGNLCNGFMNPPYMLQLAHGWPGLSLKANSAALFLIIPALVLVVPYFGAVGAAAVWFSLNAGYVLIVIHLMHRRLLSQQKWTWYRRAVAAPIAGGVVAVTLMALLVPADAGRAAAIGWLLLSGIVVGAAVLMLVPQPRAFLLHNIRFFWRRRFGLRHA